MNRLDGKVALISGAARGIGAETARLIVEAGARVVIGDILEERGRETARAIGTDASAVFQRLDVTSEEDWDAAIGAATARWGGLDILVNNAAEQHPQQSLEDIDDTQLEATFRTNIFSMFYLTRAALPHLKAGAVILNTTSVTAYRGSAHLLDYAATKGAIVAFTRSLALQLVERGIRVNGVAPGPIWTPLIPSTFSPEEVEAFGKKTPMGRPGQPFEVAAGYVFLASPAASYITGQVLHINGGEVVNA